MENEIYVLLKNECQNIESGKNCFRNSEKLFCEISKIYIKPKEENFKNNYDYIDKLIEWENNAIVFVEAINQIIDNIMEELDSFKLTLYSKVLLVVIQYMDIRDRGHLVSNISLRFLEINSFKESINYYKIANILLKKSGDLYALAKLRANYIISLINIRNFKNIDRKINIVLKLCSNNNFEDVKSKVLLMKCQYLNEIGEYDESISTLKSIVDKNESAIFSDLKNGILSTGYYYELLGKNYRNVGDLTAAINYYSKAYEEFVKEKNVKKASYLMSEIGYTWKMYGEDERGKYILNDAAKEAKKVNEYELAKRWENTYEISRDIYNKASASSILQRIMYLVESDTINLNSMNNIVDVIRNIIIFSTDKDYKLYIESKFLLSSIHYKNNNFYQSLIVLNSSKNIIKYVKDPLYEYLYYYNKGYIYKGLMYIDRAILNFQKARYIGNRILKSITINEIRQSTIVRLIANYEELVLLYAIKAIYKKESLQVKYITKLLKLVQEIHCRNIVIWIFYSSFLETKDDKKLKKRIFNLYKAEIELEMAAFNNKKDLSENFSNIIESQNNIRMRYPFLDNIKVADLNINECCSSINEKEYLINLFCVEEGVVIFSFDKFKNINLEIIKWPKQKRNRFFSEWRELQNSGNIKDEKQIYLESINLFNEVVINQLIKLLKNQSNLEKVYIVPNNELYELPYWGIVDILPYLTYTVLPSINTINILKNRKRIYYDNRFAINDVTNTLKYAKFELKGLPLFKDITEDIYENITKIEEANFLHFCTHGFNNISNPYLSGIVINKNNDTLEDNFSYNTDYGESLLTVSRIITSINLSNCYLVILSACSSAVSRKHASSNFIGMPNSFLVSGSRNVIASLWNVYDISTAILMKFFYENLFNDKKIKKVPSKALSLARLRLMDLTKDEIINIIGDSDNIPDGERPFKNPLYNMAFQNFGVD